ncbi:TY5A, partial [Symbiodinium sp. CCMP2456]
MAQVEITNEWCEEQAESSSSTARLHKTEVTYTKGIEDLLEQLESEGKDLEVTHNVDVAEVKKHLDRWRPSAEKEFYNLRDTKEAFCVTTKDQLPPSTLIVPGKAVVTVPTKETYTLQATWETGGKRYKLLQMEADPQLWQVCPIAPDGTVGVAEAHVLVYVDDMLMVGCEVAAKGFAKWIGKKWECPAPDWLGEGHDSVRFLGMEIAMGPQNEFMVSQKAYIDELLRGHDYKGSPSPAMASREALLLTEAEEAELLDAPEVVSEDTACVREAQRRVGELLWLAGRTRPDLAYPVALLSAKLLRSPRAVCTTAHRILGYLMKTKDEVLVFDGGFPQNQPNELVVYTDSSFSPSGGCMLATSIADIVTDINGEPPRLVLKVDNYSAVVKTVVANDSLKDFLKYLSVISTFCCAKGNEREVTIKEPIQVDPSVDIYLIILVIGVVSVVMWELAKAALRLAHPRARFTDYGYFGTYIEGVIFYGTPEINFLTYHLLQLKAQPQAEGDAPRLPQPTRTRRRPTSLDQSSGLLQGWSLKYVLGDTWSVDPTSVYQIALLSTSVKIVG